MQCRFAVDFFQLALADGKPIFENAASNGKLSMPEAEYDIIIAGAGVAGASTAISLAPDGYRILLLDKAVFPRDKACGEGMMPEGVRILAELGCLESILAEGGTCIRGMRYRNRQGVIAEAEFPLAANDTSFGLAIRRLDLDHALLRKARSFPNVSVRESFKIQDVLMESGCVRGIDGHASAHPTRREILRARMVIGADGRNSVFHRSCGIAKTYPRRKRFGVTGHLTGVAGTGPYVEVQSRPEGEIYISPCGRDQTLVALLLEEKAMGPFRKDLKRGYLEYLGKAEGFRNRMEGSFLIQPVLSISPLGFTVKPCYRPGLLLLGDSAGFLDPISGEGMTLALKCAKAVRPIIRDAFAAGDFGTRMGMRYAQARQALAGDLFRFTRLLLRLSRHKLLADRAIDRLHRHPQLFRKLLGIAAGSQGYGSFTWKDRASLFLLP